MSTFSGLVEEIPGISIDCFNEENLNSSAFFLSHCHTDHMKGLGDSSFLKLLKQKNSNLYCSHISKSFLQSKFSGFDADFMDNHLICLDLDDTKIVHYVYNNVEYSVSVTSISAGHCPGSVMFLFSFKNKIILYTGDFRINKEDYSKLKSLHFSKSSIPLKIDEMYLDTTFMSDKFMKLPLRADSSRALCEAAKHWIQNDPKNIIILEISASIGSEFIYKELSLFLNEKIHVRNDLFQIYHRMEVLKNYVTDTCESTPIHACICKSESRKNKGLKTRPDVKDNNILTIIISTMKWADKDTTKIIEWDKLRERTINVCYSTHASYEELESFILYFKPKKIYPCVWHEKVQESLDKIVKKYLVVDLDANVEFKSADTVNISQFKTCQNSSYKSRFTSDDEDSS